MTTSFEKGRNDAVIFIAKFKNWDDVAWLVAKAHEAALELGLAIRQDRSEQYVDSLRGTTAKYWLLANHYSGKRLITPTTCVSLTL